MEFNSQQNLPTVFSSDPAAIAAAETAKARIQAAYIMAIQKPRNPDDARVRILEACKRPKFAERVEFSKPVAGRKIKGPSVRFAELALREWGNVDIETQVIYEDEEIRRIKIRVLDLETNAGFSKEIQIKKTVERKSKVDREVVGERTNTKGERVYIVKATDDELENKQNALISKAVRNEGLRLIPSDITDEAIETAKATMRDKFAKDPKAEKKKILDSFSEIGIKPKDVEQYLKHSMDTISPAELQDLRGMYRAIRDGEATWASYIEEAQSKAEDLADKLKNGKPGAAKDLYGEKTSDSGLPASDVQTETLRHQKNQDKTKTPTPDPMPQFAFIARIQACQIKGGLKRGFVKLVNEIDWSNPPGPEVMVALKDKHQELTGQPFDPAKPFLHIEKEPEPAKPATEGQGTTGTEGTPREVRQEEDGASGEVKKVYCPVGAKDPGRPSNPLTQCSTCKDNKGCQPYDEYIKFEKSKADAF